MDRDHGRRLEAGAAAVLSADYQQAVQLLLRLVPTVFATDAFALKGGTAINLFLSPVSRRSLACPLTLTLSSCRSGCRGGRHWPRSAANLTESASEPRPPGWLSALLGASLVRTPCCSCRTA